MLLYKNKVKFKYKGFTLVELSIVLVIIGILLSIVVKGKSLINTAIYHQHINKITTMKSVAAASFHPKRFSAQDLLVGPWGMTFYKPSVLDQKTEYKTSFMKSLYKDINFMLIQIYPTADHGFTSAGDNTSVYINGPMSVGIYHVNKHVETSEKMDVYNYRYLDLNYICKLEYTLDDGDPLKGDIQYFVINSDPEKLDRNCDVYDKVPVYLRDIAIKIDRY